MKNHIHEFLGTSGLIYETHNKKTVYLENPDFSFLKVYKKSYLSIQKYTERILLKCDRWYV